MRITTYAAINIGPSEVAMKIFEVSKSKGIIELSHLRHKLSLANEIFTHNEISYKTISEICHVLNDFKEILKEYKVEDFHAYGTDSIREASNTLVFLDQIKLQTDIPVRLLSNSEERFMFYRGISMREPHFEKMIQEGALIVDVSAGTVQLSLFQDGRLQFTQNLQLGANRISELLHTLETEVFEYSDLVSEYMDKDLNTLIEMYLNKKNIRHIIAVGTHIPVMKATLQKMYPEFTGFVHTRVFTNTSFPQEMLHDTGALPTYLLFQKIIHLIPCDDIYVSATDLCDSMVAEFAEKKVKLEPKHDFKQDILSTSRNIAKRYHVHLKHVDNVCYLAGEIFDSIRKFHGLGKRERLLLQIACTLHSVGAYISLTQSSENSYKIIMSTEIIGISHIERVMIATIVRYNRDDFPSYEEMVDDFTPQEYITMIKLCTIFKMANVMDKSNTQKIRKITTRTKDHELYILAHTLKDITLEMGMFRPKADDFEKVFGIRPILKNKKGLEKDYDKLL